MTKTNRQLSQKSQTGLFNTRVKFCSAQMYQNRRINTSRPTCLLTESKGWFNPLAGVNRSETVLSLLLSMHTIIHA